MGVVHNVLLAFYSAVYLKERKIKEDSSDHSAPIILIGSRDHLQSNGKFSEIFSLLYTINNFSRISRLSAELRQRVKCVKSNRYLH